MDIGFIFSKIEEKRVAAKMPKMEFYRQIEMTETGFNNSKTNKSMKIQTLLKIAKVLGVSACYFFEEQQVANQSISQNNLSIGRDNHVGVHTIDAAIEHLKEAIREKDLLISKLIEQQDKLISKIK
jgi:transcriptional regulator with XRE-family HTH domain